MQRRRQQMVVVGRGGSQRANVLALEHVWRDDLRRHPAGSRSHHAQLVGIIAVKLVRSVIDRDCGTIDVCATRRLK
mgnify:FL=1